MPGRRTWARTGRGGDGSTAFEGVAVDRRSGAPSREGDRAALPTFAVCLIRLCPCATTYYDNLVEGNLYDGIPVDRLPIDAVDVEPEHAIEAVFDPRRLVARDPKSRIG